MKRSEISKALKEMRAACEKHSFALSPFRHITPSSGKPYVTNKTNSVTA